jgi:Got1/Sft2-like family
MDGSSSAWDYRSLLPTRQGVEPLNESESFESSSSTCQCFGYELPPLSWRERCIGCATCMIGGYLLSLGSFFRIFALIFHGNPYPLVVNCTIGNILALAGSCFFSGPKQQHEKMFQPKRRTASLAYLASLVVTLFLVVVPLPGPKALLLILCLLVQYVAVTWYCLSYIPYAHETIRSFFLQYWNGGNIDY